MKGLLKSQSEHMLGLFENLFLDLSKRRPEMSKHFRRDLETLKSRTLSEGVSFLTKTLPKLGKAFDRSLESQQLDVPREFKRSHGNQTIPAFMQAMFSCCFGPTGCLDEPAHDVIRDIRQVCYLAYKLEIPYSSIQEQSVLTDFLATEHELHSCEVTSGDPVIQGAISLITDCLRGFDASVAVPRHGPGAVATGEKLDRKWIFSRLYQSIHSVFPYYEYFVAGGSRELLDRIEWYKGLSRESEGRAKVVLVPKDSRGPRLISCEPLEFQFVQQGISRLLVTFLEGRSLASGHVNFSSQQINRDLAQSSSRTKAWATLDLKDASDRVMLDLVRVLFKNTDLLKYLLATRTSSTLLPNGSVVDLAKYAPMGSALCFPIEALCFWAICSSAIALELHTTPHEGSRSVYVYGDDIIVPTRMVDVVVSALESVHLKVNMSKSFLRGWFRESCGMDAYQGNDVTPLKTRTLWDEKRSNGAAYASWISYANEFAERGYACVAAYLFDAIERVYGKVPYGTKLSGYPCKWVRSKFVALIKNIEHGFRLRWDDRLQHVQIMVNSLKTKTVPVTVDGWPRLLRNLLSPRLDSPNRQVLPRYTQINRRWMPVI
jgi:hypothetical protein